MHADTGHPSYILITQWNYGYVQYTNNAYITYPQVFFLLCPVFSQGIEFLPVKW